MDAFSLANYHYPLPQERIAQHPLSKRDNAKLLLYKGGEMHNRRFYELPKLLPKNALLVFNDTKVIPARLVFRKSTGARIEVFCLEPVKPTQMELAMQATATCTWHCMLGNAKRFKMGETINLELGDNCLQATRVGEKEVQFNWDGDTPFAKMLDMAGRVPLPPYLNREDEAQDKWQYQTVYAREEGAVAAPTAGLHFTDEVLKELDEKGINRLQVTLHVGAGTFQPIKTDDVRQHNMHGEYFKVQREVLQKLHAHQGPIIPVGTTSMRTLESLYFLGAKLLNGEKYGTPMVLKTDEPYSREWTYSRKAALGALCDAVEDSIQASTHLMVRPGYTLRMTDGLITNYHQPGSTLILLVAALLGEEWRRVYQHALDHDYRFLSYGDSSLLLPKNE